MVSAAPSSSLATFPLERPALRVRRRHAQAFGTSLPYFIAGDENRMVAFLCQADFAVFELGNPVLLLGPSGVGKTSVALHLAARQAVSLATDGTPAAVLCMPSIDFSRQYAEAVASDDMPPFRAMIDEAPVLVVDDLHGMVDKAAAQDELAMRIDCRIRENRSTIVTCRRLPSEIRNMRPMLVSRILPGLTIAIKPPVGESRAMLLRELAMHHAVELDDELLSVLALGLNPNLPTRSLEAAIKQISLWCRMKETAPTLEAVQAAIDTVGRGGEVSLASITHAVSRYYRQKSSDLRSSSRKQQLVRSRSLAMLLARRMTSKSMHQIGVYFGGRDHTTVLHAVRKTEGLLIDDPDLRRAADEIAEKLSL